MIKSPLYRTTAIMVVLAVYVVVRQLVLAPEGVEPTAQSALKNVSVPNMSNLKQYRIGGYRLEIPTPYVQHIVAGLDKTDSIIVSFSYPEIEPLDNISRKRAGLGNSVKAVLRNKADCVEQGCEDYVFMQYKKRVMGDGYRLGLAFPDIPLESAENDLQKFSITYLEEPFIMYVDGAAEKPEEWYYCKDAAEKSFCTTAYRLEEDLVVDLTFDAKLLPERQALRTKVDETLRGFIYYKRD